MPPAAERIRANNRHRPISASAHQWFHPRGSSRLMDLSKAALFPLPAAGTDSQARFSCLNRPGFRSLCGLPQLPPVAVHQEPHELAGRVHLSNEASAAPTSIVTQSTRLGMGSESAARRVRERRRDCIAVGKFTSDKQPAKCKIPDRVFSGIRSQGRVAYSAHHFLIWSFFGQDGAAHSQTNIQMRVVHRERARSRARSQKQGASLHASGHNHSL